MSKKIKLTPAEWEIMEAVWTFDRPPSVRDVLEHAFPKGEKAYTTVQTIMNILERKGVLGRKKIGLVNFYSPRKSREELVKSEMNSLIKRIFHGSAPALTNFLLTKEDFDLDEIGELKRLLEEKERELKEAGS
jgi:BlaI family penicillinase repressor